MKKYIAFLVCVALAGCATDKPAMTHIEYVPVKPAPIVLPSRPTLEISVLTSASPADVVMKSYVATVQQLMGYSLELETLIKANNAK